MQSSPAYPGVSSAETLRILNFIARVTVKIRSSDRMQHGRSCSGLDMTRPENMDVPGLVTPFGACLNACGAEIRVPGPDSDSAVDSALLLCGDFLGRSLLRCLLRGSLLCCLSHSLSPSFRVLPESARAQKNMRIIGEVVD